MSDTLEVKIGASDAGLEATLKTVQAELSNMEAKVKSGDLSMGELEKTMKRMGQVQGLEQKLKAMGDEFSGATKSAKEFEDQIRRAETVTKSNRTALEIYSEEVDQLGKLLDSGLISQKTYAAAIEKAESALKTATPQTEEAKRANEELQASLKKAELETRALSEEQKKAESITKANRSATEIYNQEVEELQKHLSGGRISMETFEKAVAKADAKLAAANPQIEELGKDIQEAGNKSDKMGDQAGIGFGKLAAAVGVGQLAAKAFTAALDAGFAAVRGTIQGFTDALDLGGKLADLSASTGETAGNLLLLQRAFDNTGLGADKVGPVLSKLSAAINNTDEDSKKAALGFGRMGISLAELQGKSATDQLNLVSQGLQSIKDPGERAAAAVAVFGKSGAELIPLLSNFSGEIDEARATVGSLADIMDRRANVFDAVGDRFLIIQQKVRDFAAGILDKALPAIDAITSALSRIDAAAIGQRLADAFLGGQNAMKGFQAAVDAISIGQVSLAFQVFWESLKLQAMQTADSIYKNLAAGFQAAAEFFGSIFSPSGAMFQTAVSAFEYLGTKLSVTLQRQLANALAGNWLTEGIALQLNTAANEANTAANKIEDSLKGAGGRIAEQFREAGAALPQSFEENYGKIPPLFDGITEQQGKVAALEAEVAAAAAKTTEERTAQAAQTDAELAKRQALKDAQSQADAESKASKAELITLETQINESKAAGNTELAKSLEQELQSKKAKEEIAKLTEEYVKTLGVDADEAGRLATNFVKAKNAAAGVDVANNFAIASGKAAASAKAIDNARQSSAKAQESWSKILGSAYEVEKSTLAAEAALKKGAREMSNADFSKGFKEIKENLKDFGGEYEKLANSGAGIKTIASSLGLDTEEKSPKRLLLEVQQEIEKIGKQEITIGYKFNSALFAASVTSLYDTANAAFANPVPLNLNGGQSIAAVRISAEEKFAAPIAFNLHGDNTIQDVRAAAEANFANPISLTMSGSQAANDAYTTVNSAFDAPVTLGVNADTSTAQTDVASLADPQTFTLSADTASAQTQVADLGAAQTATIDADTAPAAAKVATLSDPISVQIDSNQVQAAVASMQADISNSFTGGLGGEGGEGGTGGQGGEGGMGGDATADVTSITDILNNWTNIITAIRDRLPVTALSAA